MYAPVRQLIISQELMTSTITMSMFTFLCHTLYSQYLIHISVFNKKDETWNNISLWRHDMYTTFALQAHQLPVDSKHKGFVIHNFGGVSVVILEKFWTKSPLAGVMRLFNTHVWSPHSLSHCSLIDIFRTSYLSFSLQNKHVLMHLLTEAS